MMSVITPARTAAAVGVCTGLAAAATSLAGVLPIGHWQSAVTGAAGILTTGATLIKWLHGQSTWEIATLHDSSIQALSAPRPEGLAEGHVDEAAAEQWHLNRYPNG